MRQLGGAVKMAFQSFNLDIPEGGERQGGANFQSKGFA
jgi:hypothetical protein